MDRHVLSNIGEMMKDEEYIAFFKDFEDIRRVRQSIVANMALKALREYNGVPSEEEFNAEIRRAERRLEARGDILIEKAAEIVAKQYFTEVFMTNSEVDIAVTVRNLIELRNGLDPQAVNEMTAEAMDLLGLQIPESLRNPVQQPQQLPQIANDVLPSSTPTEQAEVTQSVTLGNEQR